MRKPGLLFLLLFSLGLIDAQKLSIYPTQKYKANAGEEMLRQGKRLAEFDNNYVSALRCYQKAADFFLDKKNWEKYIETFNGIGRAYNDLAEYQKAEKYLREALTLAHKYLEEKHSATKVFLLT